MFYNDRGLNFFLDKMPTYAVSHAVQHSRTGGVRKVHSNDDIPIYNTATGLLALEKMG